MIKQLSGYKLIQDLENGLYQKLSAFILIPKRQTKAAFDFSSSAGGGGQCVFQKSSTFCWLF